MNSSTGKFEIEKLRDWEFADTCPQFVFNRNNPDALLFFKKDELFEFDYMDQAKEIKTIYMYDRPFEDDPKMAVFNEAQNKFIVCSEDDAIYINLTKPKGQQEFDMDQYTGVSNIESITSDSESFYILANKWEN